jgi:regulator of protease activity HflC (stomatin/prohibitin superfamily)
MKLNTDKKNTTSSFFKKALIISLSILILITAVLSFKIIKTSEVGIRKTSGVIHNTILKEGIHFKIPFVQSIEIFSLRQHQESFQLTGTQTKDLQPVSVDYSVLYAITEDKVLDNLKTIKGDIFEVLIAPRANESIRDALAKYSAEELISNRSEVSKFVKERLAERINHLATIDDISITSFEFENVKWKESIQKKVIAKQDAETAEIKKQQIQAEADQTIIKAKADAEAIRITANAITSNPKIVELKQVEVNSKIAEKWNGIAPSAVISSGSNNILLPLK